MQRLQTKPVMRTAGARGEWAFGRRRADAGYPVWSNILMRSIAEFTKTTLIGGILIVLPIYVSLLLLAKAVQGLLAAVKPITTGIPGFPRSFAKSWRSWRLPPCVSSPD
jgi:hypothetical protein